MSDNKQVYYEVKYYFKVNDNKRIWMKKSFQRPSEITRFSKKLKDNFEIACVYKITKLAFKNK